MDHAALRDTQWLYKTSAEYLDRLPYIEKYLLFGACQATVSIVGPNAIMWRPEGKLTDTRKWYLGGNDYSNSHARKGIAPSVVYTAVWTVSVSFATSSIISTYFRGCNTGCWNSGRGASKAASFQEV